MALGRGTIFPGREVVAGAGKYRGTRRRAGRAVPEAEGANGVGKGGKDGRRRSRGKWRRGSEESREPGRAGIGVVVEVPDGRGRCA